jgi:hypothetical protein
VKHRSLFGSSLLTFTLALVPGIARAQRSATEPPPQRDEAELPDVNAIEKGAPAPSSVSFKRAPEPPRPAPEPPRPNTGSQSKNLSAAAEASNADAKTLEDAAVGLAPPGGIYGIDPASISVADDGGPTSSVPEFHVVKKGDTLWSMCDSYFRDPWRWPKLWAQNPIITNPHWIFPGDVIRVGSAVAGGSAPAPSGPRPLITSNRQGSLESNALVLREVGFVEANDLAVSAVISGSREEKIMLSTGDQTYLKFAQDRPVRAGERYTVFVADLEHPVRASESGKVLGYMVRIYGDIVVDQIADKQTARGTLVDMSDTVERGYMVSPLVRQFKRVEPRPSAVNLETQIVAAFSPARMLAAESFVVLSRGKKDGVQVGNRTFVVRRGDGYRRVMESWDKHDHAYPNEVVGELWVVDVRENTSLAWIARSTKEIRVGETAEMRKGH